MMVRLFRVAALGAAILVSAATAGLAADPLPADVITALNAAAANNSSSDAYAAVVANIIASNPTLADSIASQVALTRPDAAVSLTTALTTQASAPGASQALQQAAGNAAATLSSVLPAVANQIQSIVASSNVRGMQVAFAQTSGGNTAAGGGGGGGDSNPGGSPLGGGGGGGGGCKNPSCT